MGIVGEDCLFLDIWRPAGTKSDDNLPIAVFIHGGGMYIGNSQFVGSHFVKKGVC